MCHFTGWIALSAAVLLAPTPPPVRPEPGKVEVTRQPSGALSLRAVHVSLERLLKDLSEKEQQKLNAESRLKDKRLHIFGEGFSRAELKDALAGLAFATWSGEGAELTLKVEAEAARTARDLRERFPEYDPGTDPAHNSRAAVVAEMMNAFRSGEALRRFEAGNPELASNLKDPMLRGALSAVGPLLPYEVYLMAGPGLRISGDRLNPAARDSLIQSAVAGGAAVQSVGAVNLRLSGTAVGIVLELNNPNGGSSVTFKHLRLGPTRAPQAGLEEAASRAAHGGNLRLPEQRIDPREVMLPSAPLGESMDWSVLLERLARVTGLKLISDVHFRPQRPGERRLTTGDPSRVWRVAPGETVSLADFVPALAESQGFTLHRRGDVLLFRHRQYYWEPLYRFPDLLLSQAASEKPEVRGSLDFVERFLNRPSKQLEGLSEVIPELKWLGANPDGVKLYASLAPEQRRQARAEGLAYRTLTLPQRQLFWIWQRTPLALAPLEPRQPLKLQVTGGKTGESLYPAPDSNRGGPL